VIVQDVQYLIRRLAHGDRLALLTCPVVPTVLVVFGVVVVQMKPVRGQRR